MPHIKLNSTQRKALFKDVTDRADRIIDYFLLGSFLFGLILATFYDTWMVAFSIGGLVLLAYYLSKFALPTQRLYQYVASASLAIFMAQFIYQMHGLFEMHFYAFVACTVMIAYSNWRLQIPLLLIIVVHHGLFAWLQFSGVEGIYFTQLPYMELSTFIFHIFLAAVIIFVSGLWGWQNEKKIIEDGMNAMRLEEVLTRNIAFADEIKQGNFDADYVVKENDLLGLSLANMRDHLKEYYQKESETSYVQAGLNELGSLLRNQFEANIPELAKAVIGQLARYLEAGQGAFFITEIDAEHQPWLQLYGGYAFSDRKQIRNRLAWGEGLVGQAAIEQEMITLNHLPEDYLLIESGLGAARPACIVAIPLLAREEVHGVLELAFFSPLDPSQRLLLNKASGIIAQHIQDIRSRKHTERLLHESQQLSEELRAQQEQLVSANQELADQAAQLSEQRTALLDQNQAIEQAREAIELKAEELAHTSKYKSEFLANMSHELRTPLNSILILARMLGQNKQNTLTEKEVKHAQVIHKAGSDLLTLINDILDLSKIESGKLDLVIEPVPFEEVKEDTEMLFRELAKEKGIHFSIDIASHLPPQLITDRVRLEQILKNLLSNAFKFTEANGIISLNIGQTDPKTSFHNHQLTHAKEVLAFEVKDSGIGIPEDKQQAIFEAFQQADGSTSRKYGGTGLGLSISRQLASLLGGEIHLSSEAGIGSTFTLFIPLKHVQGQEQISPSTRQEQAPQEIQGLSQARILIVEDHPVQSEGLRVLFEEYDGQPVLACTGKAALEKLETEARFDCIVLDLNLPDISGIDLLETIKNDPRWSEQPIVINTSMDLDQDTQAQIMCHTNSMVIKSAKSHIRLVDEVRLFLEEITEPEDAVDELDIPSPSIPHIPQQSAKVSPSVGSISEEKTLQILKGKRILLTDDDMRNVFALSAVLESYELDLRIACHGQDALDQLADRPDVDLILMDIMMPVMDGHEAMRKIREQEKFSNTPIIALTAKAMKEDRALCLEAGATEYMAKPIDPEQLVQLICQLIQPDYARTS